MKMALAEALSAERYNEVPIGAVIVCNDQVIAKAHNMKEMAESGIYHAEIIAMVRASKHLNRWRLNDCILFTTLEPCAMCASAIIQSRIKTVVIGASDSKGGAFGGCMDIQKASCHHHQVEVIHGILASSCQTLLTDFFKKKR